jgi:hypothetical protein
MQGSRGVLLLLLLVSSSIPFVYVVCMLLCYLFCLCCLHIDLFVCFYFVVYIKWRNWSGEE